MGESASACKLSLLGPFRLEGQDGGRIDISSKRGQAMLAMLATSGAGERTRAWLQDKLWGSRGAEQAQASLRRELSNLRKIVNGALGPVLHADHQRVWLDLALVTVDLRDLDQAGPGEFLEGFDLAQEDGFEDWLRSERQRADQRRQQPNPAPVPDALPPPPKLDPGFAERPALAVLPFGNGTGDPAHDLLAEGLSEDLIDRLSRLRWLPVIARSSSFALQEDLRDIRLAGLQLGARYVLDGQVRHGATGGFVLTASLGDASTGEIVWSNRIDLPTQTSGDAFAVLLDGLTSSLDFRIDVAEQRRALLKPQSDLNVRDLLWRGRWHLNRWTRDDAEAARQCFEQAIELEPNSPEALVQIAWVRLWTLWATRGSSEEFKGARQLAQRAIIADYDDARGYMLAGMAELWMRQPRRADALLRQAIELNPSLVMAHVQLGCVRHLIADHAGAIAVLERAVQLSPNDQDLFFTLGELARANLHLGHYDQALVHAENSLARRHGYWLIHVVKINALVRLDRLPEATAAYAELRRLKPDFDVTRLDWLDFMNADMQQFLRDGLNRVAA
jgi:TolB-like protein